MADATNEPINWSNFSQFATGISFSIKKDNCKIFIPTYKNLSSITSSITSSTTAVISGTEMVLKDEWSSQSFLTIGSSEKINEVLLQELWEYADSTKTAETSAAILWNDFTNELSFYDTEVAETTLYDFIKDIDTFLVYHKLSKFGNVWWVGRISSDLEGNDTSFANVYVPNISGSNYEYAREYIQMWSPDKFLNDEYKKYLKSPLNYTGFFTSSEFQKGGYFTVPDLKVSTKPFEKLKIAHVLLNLNFTFDPKYFGTYYTLDSTFASRIKDLTTNVILDNAQIKSNQNSSLYSDTIINNWIGGLVNTSNITELGEIGKFKSCDDGNKPQTISEISHIIAAQISLNPDYDSSKKELLGTIDPINWKSTEEESNPHRLGILNVDRAFGGGSGEFDSGVIFGGIQTSIGQAPIVLDTAEYWNGSFFFLANGSANTSRCFHLQGSNGKKQAVFLGGYSKLNSSDPVQFNEYGKTDVRGDMEILTSDGYTSLYRTIPNFSLATPRGDAAGFLNVASSERKDKFEISNLLKQYEMSQNAEQTLNEFVTSKSGTDNNKRFNYVYTTGFIYGGSTTGNVYKSTTAPAGELLASCERIQNIYLCVATSDEDLLNPYIKTNTCPEKVVDVITIDCKNKDGANLLLKKCGKYRLTYINGGGQRGRKIMNSPNNNVYDKNGNRIGTIFDKLNGAFGGFVDMLIGLPINLTKQSIEDTIRLNQAIASTTQNVTESAINEAERVVDRVGDAIGRIF